MIKIRTHIIRFFLLQLFLGFILLDFASTINVILNNQKQAAAQVLSNDEENAGESSSDESSVKEEKNGKEKLHLKNYFLPQLGLHLSSFHNFFGEDLLKDLHLSSSTPPPELV
jgi:hypothetical protein